MSEPASDRKSNNAKRVRRWLIEGLLFLLLLYLIHLWQTREAVHGSAPALDAQLLTGDPYSLEQQAGRRPTLVYFWATWCPVCGLTTGNVSELAKDHHVITVAMQSGETEAVRQHLRKNALQFPVIPDPEGELAKRWGVRGVPTFYVLDAQNRIRFVSVGYTSKLGLLTRLWLADE
ncbi:MAG: protein disulfide oxidoreductase [Candidatus Thiodiazotropha sp.]